MAMATGAILFLPVLAFLILSVQALMVMWGSRIVGIDTATFGKSLLIVILSFMITVALTFMLGFLPGIGHGLGVFSGLFSMAAAISLVFNAPFVRALLASFMAMVVGFGLMLLLGLIFAGTALTAGIFASMGF